MHNRFSFSAAAERSIGKGEGGGKNQGTTPLSLQGELQYSEISSFNIELHFRLPKM